MATITHRKTPCPETASRVTGQGMAEGRHCPRACIGDGADGRHLSANPAAGFTLLELLVVISIIVLLIALLLPALNSARSAGKSLACLSQTRQIGAACAAYSADNRDWEPPALWPNGAYYVWGARLIIGGYIAQRANLNDDNGNGTITDDAPRPHVYLCPDTGSRAEVKVGSVPVGFSPRYWATSYGYNYNFGFTTTWATEPPAGTAVSVNEQWPIRRDRVAKPSIVIRLADSVYRYAYLRALPTETYMNEGTGQTGDAHVGMIGWRHNNGQAANVLFADGHAGPGTRATIPVTESTTDNDPNDPWMARGRFP